jgi:hypothetical protein
VIGFWVDAKGAFGIRNYLALRGAPLRERITVHPYDWRESSFEVPGGTQLFSALDQLSEPEREVVAELYDQMARQQPGSPPLNDPRRCLLRPALLRELAEQGLNSFRVFAFDDTDLIDRFPVFVRESHAHDGSLTRLIHSRSAILRALRALRVRGYRKRDLLIVEFCDTSDKSGVFRKYSAFKVGSRIVATHLIAAENWMVKSATKTTSLELAREELAYAEHNPYQDWLERVFTLAGIDYGRIDFGVLDGRPQAWEINLNPTIGRSPGAPESPADPETAAVRSQARELFHGRLREAFAALDCGVVLRPLSLRLDPQLVRRIKHEHDKSRRRLARWSWLRSLYHSRRAGALRALGARIFPGLR